MVKSYGRKVAKMTVAMTVVFADRLKKIYVRSTVLTGHPFRQYRRTGR